MQESASYRGRSQVFYRPKPVISTIGKVLPLHKGLDSLCQDISPKDADEYIRAIYDDLVAYAVANHEVEVDAVEREFHSAQPRYVDSIDFSAMLGEDDGFSGRVFRVPAYNGVGMSPHPDRIKLTFSMETEDPVYAEFYEDMGEVIDYVPETVEALERYEPFK